MNLNPAAPAPPPAIADVHVSLPRHWETRNDLARGVLADARARELPPSGFPPQLVVRCVPVEDDLARWRAGAMEALALQLDGFDLEDEDEFHLGGEEEVAYRRFSYLQAGTEVVAEQWSWLVEGFGVTLTGSVARADYATYCDVFEQLAATVSFIGTQSG